MPKLVSSEVQQLFGYYLNVISYKKAEEEHL